MLIKACDSGKRRDAFTLIELLVVIAIIALLLSVLFPSLQAAKAQAKSVLCQSNLSQLGKALEMYELENDNKRFVIRKDASETDGYWWGKLAPYFKDSFEVNQKEGKSIDVLMCPSAPASRYDKLIQTMAGPGTGYFGTASRPWGWTRSNGSTIGSYTINGWIGYDYLYDTTSGLQEYMYRNWLDVAPNVPVLGCGRWAAAWPKGSDARPNPSDPEDKSPISPMGMGIFSIDRHRSNINLIYKDLHVEPTRGLEQLWQLRWHKNYEPR